MNDPVTRAALASLVALGLASCGYAPVGAPTGTRLHVEAL